MFSGLCKELDTGTVGVVRRSHSDLRVRTLGSCWGQGELFVPSPTAQVSGRSILRLLLEFLCGGF